MSEAQGRVPSIQDTLVSEIYMALGCSPARTTVYTKEEAFHFPVPKATEEHRAGYYSSVIKSPFKGSYGKALVARQWPY